MTNLTSVLREIKAGALEKKGRDIVVLDVRKLSDITDYYFIVAAQNERQVKAMRDEIERRLQEKFGIAASRVAGAPSSKWVVIDYGDVIVHVFEENLRKYYELERLWGDAKIKKL